MNLPRISDQLRTNLGQRQIRAGRHRLHRAERVASTLVEIARPSDAPPSWSGATRLDEAIDDQRMYARNAESATGTLSMAESALSEAGEVLKRAQELAVQLSSGTYGAAERDAAAIEVDGLREDLRNLANAKVGGRYLFAGQALDTEPFADDGSYNGGPAGAEVRVGHDTWIATGLDGSDAFLGAADPFAALEDLAVALRADDATGIRDTLDPLTASTTRVIAARSGVGAAQRRAEDSADAVGAVEVALSERLAELVQADPAEAYTRLAEQRLGYEATLQVLSSSSSARLFNFIR